MELAWGQLRDMMYRILNPFTWNFEIFDTNEYQNAYELSQAKLAEYQKNYLAQEKMRFHFVKVNLVKNKELWVDADIPNDPEEGDYRVFSQYTGTYDSFSTLSEAVADFTTKQQNFMVSIGLDAVRALPEAAHFDNPLPATGDALTNG